MNAALLLFLLGGWVSAALPAAQPVFRFPTANQALLKPEGGEAFFVGTVGRSWTSGMFGCVRTEGRQIHEGIDIKCLQRDRQGEPIDPVTASADGTVVYLSHQAGLSNYGRYVILRHQIEQLEVYSLYAHLRSIRDDLRLGQAVKAGDRIATLGRSTNTRQSISKERAHVHFELVFLLNDRFPAWHQEALPGQRNDHGIWNGQNLIGLDPSLILLGQAELGSQFSLLKFVRQQTELCRVLVRDTRFPWLKRYTALIRRNPVADREGVAGYEVALNYNGVPFQLIPKAPSEIPGSARFQLVSVNEPEALKNPCRRLIERKGGSWELGARGVQLLELLTY